MKKLSLSIIAIFVIAVSAYADYGTLSSESESGLNKICYYDTPSGTKVINVKSYEICPVSYNF